MLRGMLYNPLVHTIFTEEQWAKTTSAWTAWWNHDIGRPMLTCQRSRPFQRPAWWGLMPAIPFEITPEQIAEEIWQNIANTEYFGDSYPAAFMNFGPGDIAGFVGGEVTPAWNTTWFGPGKWEGRGLREITPEYDPGNIWFRRVKAVMKTCVEKFAGRAVVSYTDLGGNLDIAAPLRGTQTLLTDTLDDPGAVRELVGIVTKLWIRYFDGEHGIIAENGRGFKSWLPMWAPGSTYELQCDFSYMISPAQFDDLVMPDLTACCDHIEYPVFHLDGPGILNHLEALLSIGKLRCIQWFAGDNHAQLGKPSCKWAEVLDRIRGAGKLVQMHGTFPDFMELAKERPLAGYALDITGGIPDGMNPADAMDAIRRANV